MLALATKMAVAALPRKRRRLRVISSDINRLTPQFAETRSRHLGGGLRSYGSHYFDVAVCGFRVRTLQVRAVHDLLSDYVLDARQAGVEAGLNQMTPIGRAEVYFSVDGDVGRQRDLQRVGDDLDRRKRTSRPTRGE